MFSPGHTLASMTYLVDGKAFVHDTLFMPDGGTARADFPGGSASDLWRSIQRILDLPDETRLFTGHDYTPKGREPAWQSTVAKQKSDNVHPKKAPSETEFVRMRNERDKELPLDAARTPGEYRRWPASASWPRWKAISKNFSECLLRRRVVMS